MLEKTYRCDLCRVVYDPEDMLPVRRVSGTIEKAVEDYSEADMHICKSCVRVIKESCP